MKQDKQQLFVPQVKWYLADTKRTLSISLSHHAAIGLARVEIRYTQSYPLSVDRHITLNKPFIPHLAIISLSPETDFDL